MHKLFGSLRLRGINSKFLFPVITLSIAGLLALSLISYFSFRATVIDSVEQISFAKAQKLQSKIYDKIEKWKSEILILTSSEEAAGMDIPTVISFLQNKKKYLNDFLFLHVADKNGNYWTTDGKSDNNSSRNYFKKVMAGEVTVSEPIISKTTGVPIIIITAPIRNSSGQVIGSIAGSIELSKITSFINSERIARTGYAVMLDNNGVFMTHPNNPYILKKSAFDFQDPGIAALAKKMINGQSGIEYYSFRGDRKLAAFVPVGINNWSVAISVSTSEIFENVTTLGNRFAVTAGIVIILMCILILSFNRKYILKPIRDLEKAADIVSAGNLEHVIEMRSEDEFGQVSAVFNRMTKKLLENSVERKRIEDALRESQHLLSLFFSQSLDGFYITKIDEPVEWNDSVDKDKVLDYVFQHERIIMVNDAMISQYGSDREKFVGIRTYELVSYNIEASKEGWKRLFDAGRTHVETDERKLDGTQIWIEGIYTCLYDDKKRIVGHFGVQRDITERKQIENDLIKAKEKAEHSEKLKTEFLAQMSHEIRTPVNTILSFNSLLSGELQGKIPPELQDCFNIINMGGRRLIRTIDLILNMSEIQVGSYEPNISSIDVDKDIICNLIAEFNVSAQTKGLELSYTNSAKNSVICADSYTLTQIFVNLIDNAVKFTNKGRVEVSLFDDEEGRLAAIISDTGIGITKEYMPKMFEPFSQEDSGYTRRFEGNGLGLPLVKKYCELNNAEIFVESEKGKGSSFTVVFSNLLKA